MRAKVERPRPPAVPASPRGRPGRRQALVGRRRRRRRVLEARPVSPWLRFRMPAARPLLRVQLLNAASDGAKMNTPPATRPAAVVTPTLQQLPRLDAILGCEEAHAPAMPAIDWSTAREAPYTPSMDVPRHGTDDARRRRKNFARRRSSGPADATPSSVMHVIARGSSDQWKTFASSPLMAAAMLIDGAVDEIYDE